MIYRPFSALNIGMAITLGIVLWRLSQLGAPKMLMLAVVLIFFADNIDIFTEDAL